MTKFLVSIDKKQMEGEITQLLATCESMTALTISKTLKVTKTEVNSLLYRRKDLFKGTTDQPPKWSLINKKEKDEEEEDIIVLIDLGNIHNMMDNLLPYLDKIKVWLYADKMYNGKELTLPPHKNMRIVHDKSGSKNAVEVCMIWDIAKNEKKDRTFLILSRDQGFGNIVSLCPSCKILTSWDELKIFVA